MLRGVVAIALVCASSLAHAQERNLDIERFRPAPDREGFLAIPGTRTPGPWMWNVSLWTGYALEPLVLVRPDDGTRLPIVRHRVSGDLIAQLGVTDRIAITASVPMVLWQDTDASPLGTEGQLAAVALRDPYYAVRVRVLGDGASGRHGDNDGGGLALQVAGTLPFGLEHTFAGEGAPQLEGAVIGDFHFLSLGIGAIAGYRHRFAEPRLLGVPFANELFFGAAIESPLFFVENLTAIAEIRVETALDEEAFRGESTAVESDVGVRWSEGDLAVTWVVGGGFTGGAGDPVFRGMAAVEWAPRTHDADGDGIEDERERPDCVRLPEDYDEFEDDDGCPDVDNDGDLVADEDDRCPLEAAEHGRDEDEDGCTDPVHDADRDGIADEVDACPHEREDRDGHEDDDGCPDPDNDADDVLDADDQCPNVAEDRDGYEDDDGCPDPDDDLDGLGDADDRCPRDAEDRDGHDDGDGCPDIDDDRDGALDAHDRCPGERETINGVDDGDGCPDHGGQPAWTAVEAGDLPGLRGRVRFDAAGVIAPASIGAVDQLARHLIARWGSPWTIAIPTTGDAGRDVARRMTLLEALVIRDAPRAGGEATFSIVIDPSLRGTSVEVRRAPPSSGAATPALEAPHP